MKNNYSFKALFISFLLLIFSNPALYSQAFLPFAQSNYAGASGLILQPASIADSRYKQQLCFYKKRRSFEEVKLGRQKIH